MEETYIDGILEYARLNEGRDIAVKFNPVNRDKFNISELKFLTLIEDEAFDPEKFLLWFKEDLI